MNKDKFLEYLEIYGADIERWPEEVKASASALFQSGDVEVLSAIEREASFDQLLDDHDDFPAMSMSLEARLIDLVPVPAIQAKLGLWDRLKSLHASKWAAAGIMSASLLGGVSVGYAQAFEQTELYAVNTMLEYASSEELSDLDADQWVSAEEMNDE